MSSQSTNPFRCHAKNQRFQLNLPPSLVFIFLFTALSLFILDSPITIGEAAFEQPSQSNAGIPAFPGAEGFGAQSVGGRGGRVIEITNLNNSGPGSLRACAQDASGPRICVFRVAGEIFLTGSRLAVKNPYLTIAGQTAPGDGITIRAATSDVRPVINFHKNVHDVIVRHIKVRLGFTGETGSEERDVITIHAGQDIILDHISAQWGTDEGVSISPGEPGEWVKGVTIQRSIIAEGLRPHSTGGDPSFVFTRRSRMHSSITRKSDATA